VLDVIETAREVTGRKIEVRVEARRAGDPSHLVADATRAREILGWQPRYPSLKEIIGTAWKWQEAHPDGYRES
jgi:UDP-glucose 4-epimerase